MSLSIIGHGLALPACTSMTNCYTITRRGEDHQIALVPHASSGRGCARQTHDTVLILLPWPLAPQSVPHVRRLLQRAPLAAFVSLEAVVVPHGHALQAEVFCSSKADHVRMEALALCRCSVCAEFASLGC